MKRFVLFAALAVSLLVPAAAAAVFVAASTQSFSTPQATSLEKLQLYDMFKEAARLDAQATQATPGTIIELRQIAREARAWANRYETEAEWEEFALATSAYAQLLADGLSDPGSVTREDHDQVVTRLDAANAALPERLRLG